MRIHERITDDDLEKHYQMIATGTIEFYCKDAIVIHRDDKTAHVLMVMSKPVAALTGWKYYRIENPTPYEEAIIKKWMSGSKYPTLRPLAFFEDLLKPHPHQVQAATPPTTEPCKHPAARLYSWFTYDGTQAVACCDCGNVLHGAGMPANNDEQDWQYIPDLDGKTRPAQGDVPALEYSGFVLVELGQTWYQVCQAPAGTFTTTQYPPE